VLLRVPYTFGTFVFRSFRATFLVSASRAGSHSPHKGASTPERYGSPRPSPSFVTDSLEHPTRHSSPEEVLHPLFNKEAYESPENQLP